MPLIKALESHAATEAKTTRSSQLPVATMRRSEKAIRATSRIARMPGAWWSHLSLAVIYTELGREAEARSAAAEVLRQMPQYSLAVKTRMRVLYKDPTALDRELAALRQAGLE